MLTSSGGSLNADRGGKIYQNLADVICERSLWHFSYFCDLIFILLIFSTSPIYLLLFYFLVFFSV